MSCETLEETGSVERLRAEYNAAFNEWALRVRYLQAIEGSAEDRLARHAAKAYEMEAECAYRRSRDRLADALWSGKHGGVRGSKRSEEKKTFGAAF